MIFETVCQTGTGMYRYQSGRRAGHYVPVSRANLENNIYFSKRSFEQEQSPVPLTYCE